MTPTADLLESLPDAPALEAIDVVKRYDGNAVLDQVSLRVERGEFVALVGESGAGKTTLLRMFNRTVAPDGGRICVGGRDVLGMNPSNLCFGGPDGRTIYVTEVEHTRLVQFRVDRPGLAWQRWQEKQ